MKRVYDMREVYTSFLEYLNETPPEELEKDLKEFDHWNNVGPTVEEYLNYNNKMKITGFKRGAYIFLNTPEIRERLEQLGYKKNNNFGVEGGDAILTYPYYREDWPDQIYPHYVEVTKNYFNNDRYSWGADRVNCGTDVEKFFKVVSEKLNG